jgi:hypothetical protein
VLISARCEGEEDYARDPIAATAAARIERREAPERPVAFGEELRNQVWLYAHGKSPAPLDGRTAEYALERGEIRPMESRGRKRVLAVVRATPHTESVVVWPERGPPDVLPERSVCARRMREFVYRRRAKQPDFFEAPIVLAKPSRWRERRAGYGR